MPASRLCAFLFASTTAALSAAQEPTSRLSDEVLAPQIDAVPERPFTLELGNRFLGTGPIGPVFASPTGDVLQPGFLLFGSLRTALQSFDNRGSTTTEWASRLDLFGNLQLSGTERILAGIRPLDDNGDFTNYVFDSDTRDDGWNQEFNGRITALFFEGDLGEMFPALDRDDGSALDIGIAVGRQALLVQEGLLIDDTIDGVGIVRNTLLPAPTSNLRVTGFYGWNEVGRDNNEEDEDANLFGLFSEADIPCSTVSFDAIWLNNGENDTDALFFGAGAVQRIGHYNTAFRCASSFPSGDETPQVSQGTLLFAELSRNAGHADDLVYLNAFWGIDEFSSAARGPDRGGPLGRTGILFAAVGLGDYGAALGNEADESFGGSLGYQTYLGDELHRRQLILEIGGRDETSGPEQSALAAGFRYEQAFGQHTILRLDGFVTGNDEDEASAGARVELELKF